LGFGVREDGFETQPGTGAWPFGLYLQRSVCEDVIDPRR
jgi:hypothetical protein